MPNSHKTDRKQKKSINKKIPKILIAHSPVYYYYQNVNLAFDIPYEGDFLCLAVAAPKIVFFGQSIRNLNYTKFNKEIT